MPIPPLAQFMVIILPFIQISFLMRMVDLIGKHPPINVLKASSSGMSSLEMSLREDDDDMDCNDLGEEEIMPRMKIICQFAREVLLSHVKKDVNLTVYPGSIQFPGDLYSRRRPSSTSPVNAYAYNSDQESEESSRKKTKKPKKSISHYVKKSQDEMPLSDSDQSDDEDNLGGEGKSPEKQNDSLSEDTYEHSPSFSPADQQLEKSSHTKQKKLKISQSVKKSHDNMPLSKSDPSDDLDNYEHSPSFSPSASTPHSGNGGYDNNFGDVSPISQSDSPAVVVAKGANKRSSVQVKKPKPSVGKRKSKAIDVFDEFPTPVTDAGDTNAVNSAKKLKSTPRASKGSNSKKTKATPVSVPKSVMVNVTNSTTTSSRSGSATAAPSQKKKATKTRVVKSVDEMDDFDFSDSPAKPKSTGRLGKKSSSAASSEKAAPARKARAPTKSKVAADKKTSQRGNSSKGKSPSATSEAPVYRAGKRGARASRA
jgi:hypothetical protein